MKQDNYATEEQTRALIAPDTRTEAEKTLDEMLERRGAWEMGVEPYNVLYQIAAELIFLVYHKDKP